jgi:uncharacterized repeat protein (TIGR03803 family)
MKKNFTSIFLLSIFMMLTYIGSLKAQTPVIYGMTYSGGTDSSGTIFSYNLSTGVETVLWNFRAGSDGGYPLGGLLWDAGHTTLYGVTSAGGIDSNGTLFSYTPSTGAENVLWNFGASGDGISPTGNLVWGTGGNTSTLYGLTNLGGTYDPIGEGYPTGGVLYSFNTINNRETVLHDFGAIGDGFNPFGSLVSALGQLYGMTSDGGSNTGSSGYTNGGVVFAYNSTYGLNVLHSFNYDGTDAAKPIYGSLLFDDSTSTFYGLTAYGGLSAPGSAGNGGLFSFNPSNGTDSLLWTFGDSTDGANPYGSLVWNANHSLLYGTTYQGGTNHYGTIFSFDPHTASETVVWNFGSNNDGALPYSDLLWDPNTSLFYGMTDRGGTLQDGTIFSFDPVTRTEQVVHNFGVGTDGAFPSGSLILSSIPNSGINEAIDNIGFATLLPNPFAGQTELKFELNKAGEVQVNIYDLLGNIVAKQSTRYNAGIQEMTVGTDLAAGAYLLRIRSDDQNRTIKMIRVE